MNNQLHLTINETIKTYGIRRTKLYELLGSGEVKAVKLGRRTLVYGPSLRQFMERLPSFLDQVP